MHRQVEMNLIRQGTRHTSYDKTTHHQVEMSPTRRETPHTGQDRSIYLRVEMMPYHPDTQHRNHHDWYPKNIHHQSALSTTSTRRGTQCISHDTSHMTFPLPVGTTMTSRHLGTQHTSHDTSHKTTHLLVGIWKI